MKLSDLLYRDMSRDRYRMQLTATCFVSSEALMNSEDKTRLVINTIETLYHSWLAELAEKVEVIKREGIEDDITGDPNRLTTGYSEVDPRERQEQRGYYRPSDPLPDPFTTRSR